MVGPAQWRCQCLDGYPISLLCSTEKQRMQTQRLIESVSRTHAEPVSDCKIMYPKASQHSMYKEYWEPYIAANLHLYTVPLALFLRRSRELDFSPREYQRSLNTVRRVFRVFSPEVVAVISKLLKKEPGSKWAGVVARHESNLGPHVPPKFEHGLTSCQDDIQNLLEEIYSQHLKKIDSMDVIDRSIAFIEGFFGGGAYAGEEKELQLLINQAKAIVGFPDNFEVVPSRSRLSRDSQALVLDINNGMERASNGLFSETGVQRISTGTSKCNPLDIGYVGDRMLSRPRSHEITFLIPILVKVSIYLNSQFGLQVMKNDGFDYDDTLIPRRFNLRFLADYRNLMFIAFCYLVMKLVVG